MDQTTLSVIIGITALLSGLIAGKLIFAKNTKKQIEEAYTAGANLVVIGTAFENDLNFFD